jgi:hypothetical protein
MKISLILGVLLLPTLAAAQQSTVKTGQSTNPPYRVIATREPVALSQPAFDLPGTPEQDGASEIAPGKQNDPVITWSDSQSKYSAVLLPVDGQSVLGSTLFAAPAQSNVRVNLNLRNAPLKEAVKQLSEQTKQEFVLENDVPADARVTVVAKNIRLSTALNLLTEATDLKWGSRSTKRSDGKSPDVVYHIGKTVPGPFEYSNATLRYFTSPKDNQFFQWNGTDKNLKLYYKYDTPFQKPGTAPKNNFFPFEGTPLILKPGTSYNLTQPLKDTLKGGTILPNGQYNLLGSGKYTTLGNSLVATNSLTEVRSTFTCPHCKQQVTVIHKHESPKCEKCGRVFHDDWQFCPFDGAKRPASTDSDWQFCPICGKSIKPDSKPENSNKGGN